MAIVFPLALPSSPAPAKMTFPDYNTVAITASPFSGVQQVQEHRGQWWRATLIYAPMNATVGARMVAFWRSLRGPAGTLLLHHPQKAAPAGTAGDTPGTPEVDGAGQTGLVLNIKSGLTGPVPLYLFAGDLFSLGTGSTRRLHVLTADANLDGAGKAALDIWPRLRESPGDGDDVALTNATGRFRLVAEGIEPEEDQAGNVRIAPIALREAI